MTRSLTVVLAIPCAILLACSANSAPDVPDAGHSSTTDAGANSGARPDEDAATTRCDAMTCASFCTTGSVCAGATCVCGSADGCAPGSTAICYSGPLGRAAVGACSAGTSRCVSGGDEFGEWGPCVGEVLPAAESCNEIDDDCDGLVDEEVSCIPPGDPCEEGDECMGEARCVEFPSGRRVCDDPTECFGVADGRGPRECTPGKVCTEFPDGRSYCYDQPKTACWSHVWFDSVTADGIGHHYDTCMSCTGRPGLEHGSTCTHTRSASDLLLECDPVSAGPGEVRISGPVHFTHDFLAIDIPLHNPAEMGRCLVAWGVHPLLRLGETRLRGSATARIPGGASATAPIERGGFRTLLPAAAFQQVFVEDPPPTTVPVPTRKDERGARVFWEEASMTSRRTTALHAPYEHCPTCATYEDLISHMYPGPEIFCQGLPRDPADSQFVIPLWLPYYDAMYGQRDLIIITESICDLPVEGMVHSVSAWPIPERWPATLPATFP